MGAPATKEAIIRKKKNYNFLIKEIMYNNGMNDKTLNYKVIFAVSIDLYSLFFFNNKFSNYVEHNNLLIFYF